MIAIVVLVLGLVVGIVVPFFWASPLPVLLGAALLVVAGFLSKRGVLVVAAIVAAALLAVSPALINGYRNRQGIAWTVPEGERLELAEGSLAVTSADSALRGRDLRTGDRAWELRLPDAGHSLRVWPAGPLVLTTGFDDTLRAVDAASGKVRWESPGRVTFLGVSDGEHIAVTRCGATIAECEVQSLSLADGRVAWRAPVAGAGEYLGVPLLDDGAPQRDLPPWAASFVLVTATTIGGRRVTSRPGACSRRARSARARPRSSATSWCVRRRRRDHGHERADRRSRVVAPRRRRPPLAQPCGHHQLAGGA